MIDRPLQKTFTRFLLPLTLSLALLPACSDSGALGAGSEQILSSDVVYNHWPNETTSSETSSEVTSKVLVRNLDNEGAQEHVFISVLPNSSNKRNSILRVTQGVDYSELVNFNSNRIALLQDSIPFAYDFNEDGLSELLFVSYDRDRVYAFEFKNKLKKLFVRWTADLPETLDVNFDRRLQKIIFKDEPFIKVGPFGLTEIKNKKVSVVDLRVDEN